eukprot:jgi/Hompol1/6917/HPOL_002474-RA
MYNFNPAPGVSIPIYSYSSVEWAYRKGGHPKLPSLARGLFVRKATTPGSDWQIAARGYDKFFNVGEVPTTSWRFIQEGTVGPYEITLKENGCIIFISSVDGHILVTSKHSLGHAKPGSKPSHAQKGEEWLDKHLKSAGATRKQLSDFLAAHNVTAIFELADDDFEEHILEYPPERSGLYLHGLNNNTPEFSTWDSNTLADFAKTFGFLLVECIIKNTAEGIDLISSYFCVYQCLSEHC